MVLEVGQGVRQGPQAIGAPRSRQAVRALERTAVPPIDPTPIPVLSLPYDCFREAVRGQVQVGAAAIGLRLGGLVHHDIVGLPCDLVVHLHAHGPSIDPPGRLRKRPSPPRNRPWLPDLGHLARPDLRVLPCLPLLDGGGVLPPLCDALGMRDPVIVYRRVGNGGIVGKRRTRHVEYVDLRGVLLERHGASVGGGSPATWRASHVVTGDMEDWIAYGAGIPSGSGPCNDGKGPAGWPPRFG